jgi:hypothetical protein
MYFVRATLSSFANIPTQRHPRSLSDPTTGERKGNYNIANLTLYLEHCTSEDLRVHLFEIFNTLKMDVAYLLSRPHTQREECAVKSVHACPKLNPYSL